MPLKPRPAIDRLFDRLAEDANGCWIFTGATSEGYGVIGRGGRGEGNEYAHRLMYEHFIHDVPEGLHIDHLCRVRACCNPWHLEPVSQAENNVRAAAANARIACGRGHTYTTESSYRNAAGKRVCRTCRYVRYHAQGAAA